MLPKPVSRHLLSLSKTTPGIPHTVNVTLWGRPINDAQHVVFYFGGLPASAEEPALHSVTSPHNDVYQAHNIALLYIDKPGFGETSFNYWFRLRRDWPVIVDQVATQLGVADTRRYGVMGVSNGGPYVMATLTHPILKHRVKAAANIVGVSDVVASGYFSWKSPSTAFEGIYNSLPTFITGPFTALGMALGKIYLVYLGGYQAVLGDQFPLEGRPVLAKVMQDSMKHLGIPASIDCQQGLSPLYARSSSNHDPTSVDQNATEAYQDIKVPVTLWYGTKDSSVPMASAEWLAETMPNATLHKVDSGHGLYLFHTDQLLDEFVRILDQADASDDDADSKKGD
ncbi:alpha/beta hydrolase fold [Seminavis robusta]|uniref:Alpha/beta hydrolase fold n=1 Tax=Seminavis robusta TaxID=568900 RepID=A0A9N8H6F3_9STRA|nr:alpha/beta hydrolase fold [Seminavis robusta]|eukprot:Sro42_g025850.1 alpha/beta hydrolase fold (340) ;mRNA; f:141352-142371